MKALVLREYNSLVVEEVPEPVAGTGEVLVEVHACGICGSDVHGMDGSTGRRIPPVIMGHEAAGVVAEVGHGVTGIAPGERVTFDSTVYCGVCPFCRKGRVNLCERREVMGVSCREYRRNGAFAEYVTVPARIIYRLPEGLKFEHAAMAEPLSVALHAVSRMPMVLGATALVIGAGVIGLLIVQVLRRAGCDRIIVSDVDRVRLDLAKQSGADIILDAASCEVPAEVAGNTAGAGADVVFEAVGIPGTVCVAVASARKGGAVGLVGNVSQEAPFPLQAAVTRELTLYGSCASSGEYPACLDLLACGAIDVAPLISAVAPLGDGALWFKRLHGREPGLMKVILVPRS